MVINPTRFRKNNLTQLGFGLVELMVSISVMVLVTSVILVKHDSYNGATLLRSQAYDIALQLRELQLLSISATEAGSGFRNVYGIYFDTANDDFYPIFRDQNDDDFYDPGEEFGKQGFLDPRFAIDAIRLIGGASATNLSISFQRPNFDARIFTAANSEVVASVSGVEIDIRTRGTTGAGSGKIRTIEITRAGQITVK